MGFPCLKPFDNAGQFSAAPKPEREVRQLAVRGAGATLFSGGFNLAVQMVATVVLARMLAPAEFGLVAMATTFSALLMNFGGNGFNEAIIQREELSNKLASNLFWINLGIGTLLSIAFACAGGLISGFYGDPLVSQVCVGMSLTILFSSFSVLHLALMRRAMRFSAVAANDMVARVCSVAVSVVLALAGMGHWALVGGAVTLPLVTSLGAWLMCSWTPMLPGRVPGTASMVRFALNTYGRFAVNYATRNGDNVLVGWRFQAEALGFYKKAYDLFALSAGALVTPLTSVVVSTLSRLKCNEDSYRQYLLDAIDVVTLVGAALGAVLTVVGGDLIRLLLGAGWERSGQIFQFFGPGVGAMMLYCTHSWIHLSIGRADRWFRWGIVELVVTGLLFILGLQRGPEGVAVAWSASFWLLTIPAIWYAGRPIKFGIAAVFSVVWKYFAAATLAGGLTFVSLRSIPQLSGIKGIAGPLTRIPVACTSIAILYVFGIIVLHRGVKPLRRLAMLLREMIPLRRTELVHQVRSTILANHNLSDSTASDSITRAPCTTDGPPREDLVSILIPARNAQNWIADTLRSAIAQTWEPKEIILVDDGSTDKTLTIARQFSRQGVQVESQKNQGAAAARNLALSLSRGAYIQWLDADDLLAPDKIARQMAVFGETGNKRLVLSGSFGRFMYRHYCAEFTPSQLWADLSAVDWLVLKMEHNVFMQTATWLVSRELTDSVGPWDTRLLADDDGEYFCRVLLASDGVRFVPESKVYFRTPWFTSLGYVGRSDSKLSAHWLSMQLHIRHLRAAEDSDRVRRACVTYLQNNFSYFYPERCEVVEEIQRMAVELGGSPLLARLPVKYYCLQTLFGWEVAKNAQRVLPKIRWTAKRYWDRVLFEFDRSVTKT